MTPLTAHLVLATVIFKAALLLFWAALALPSALPLSIFGTWLPQHTTGSAFADVHRARSSGFGSFLSLMPCFRFGRHHKRHPRPDLPW